MLIPVDRGRTALDSPVISGMVDVVVGEIHPPEPGADWKRAVRQLILSARRAFVAHPWACRVIESRAEPTPVILAYMDSLIGMLRTGGFSVSLTHHVMHALGSRMLGFTQELFDDKASIDPEEQALMLRAMAGRYPHVAEMAMAASHEDASIVGSGCDDQFEFEFALDLLLDGYDRLQQEEQTSAGRA